MLFVGVYDLLVCMLLLSSSGLFCADGVEFHRNFTGVTFSPYVKLDRSDTQYLLNDVKVMLKIISGKFSNVITTTSGAQKRGLYFYFFRSSNANVYFHLLCIIHHVCF